MKHSDGFETFIENTRRDIVAILLKYGSRPLPHHSRCHIGFKMPSRFIWQIINAVYITQIRYMFSFFLAVFIIIFFPIHTHSKAIKVHQSDRLAANWNKNITLAKNMNVFFFNMKGENVSN